jgi:hypothetical protein
MFGFKNHARVYGGRLAELDRVKLLRAGRTNAVGKIRFRVLLHVHFELLPGALIIPNSFTRGTDRQESSQRLQLRGRFLKLSVNFCNQ